MTPRSRKRGRPARGADQRSADVHLTLKPSEYDAAYQLATTHDVTVQVVIRRALARLLNDERGGHLIVTA